jgi:hypothetical protein
MQQDLELSTTNILSLFETSRSERKSFVTDVIGRLENGEIDPLKVHLQLKAMEDVVTQFTDKKKYPETAKAWTDAVLTDAQQRGKSFEYFNAKFEVKETGVSYDYSKCEDLEWANLDAQIKQLSEKKKAREKMLQFVSGKGQIVTDQESGDTWTVYPPAKTSTTSVAVTLK